MDNFQHFSAFTPTTIRRYASIGAQPSAIAPFPYPNSPPIGQTADLEDGAPTVFLNPENEKPNIKTPTHLTLFKQNSSPIASVGEEFITNWVKASTTDLVGREEAENLEEFLLSKKSKLETNFISNGLNSYNLSDQSDTLNNPLSFYQPTAFNMVEVINDLHIESKSDISKLRKKKKPYKELTLEEKVELIRLAESHSNLSQASIAERYTIAKSNVCRILQRKEEYLTAYESSGYAASRKRKIRSVGENLQKGKPENLVTSENIGSQSLKAHMLKQHQISLLICRCCNLSFNDKASLHAHKKQQTRQKEQLIQQQNDNSEISNDILTQLSNQSDNLPTDLRINKPIISEYNNSSNGFNNSILTLPNVWSKPQSNSTSSSTDSILWQNIIKQAVSASINSGSSLENLESFHNEKAECSEENVTVNIDSDDLEDNSKNLESKLSADCLIRGSSVIQGINNGIVTHSHYKNHSDDDSGVVSSRASSSNLSPNNQDIKKECRECIILKNQLKATLSQTHFLQFYNMTLQNQIFQNENKSLLLSQNMINMENELCLTKTKQQKLEEKLADCRKKCLYFCQIGQQNPENLLLSDFASQILSLTFQV